MKMRPLSELEQSIAKKFSEASFPPATACKRFARDLAAGYIKQLSHNGRRFLAYAVNRYRRQYTLTPEEWNWVQEWLSAEYEVEPKPEPKKRKSSPLEPQPQQEVLTGLEI